MNHTALGFLPAVCFCMVFLALRCRLRDRGGREAFLAAAIVLGGLIVFGTEGLSWFHAITFPAVTVFWVVVSAGAALFLWLSWRPAAVDFGPREKVPLDVWFLLGGVAIYVLAIGSIGLIAPPNTGDTFEYHMPRVHEWIEHASVSFFPTSIPRQNHLGPGAEYVILHLQVLSGSDRFANMVEWFSMVGSLLGVSLVARQLGATIRGQMLAAVFAATLPMGIMQASSTQTDYVVGFCLVMFAYYTFRLLQSSTPKWSIVLAAAAAVGLAVFAKATAYVFGSVFALSIGTVLVVRHRLGAVRYLAAFFLVFVAFNATHYARNWALYRNPLGPGREPDPNTEYAQQTHVPAAMVSSLAKNIGTHLNTPWPTLNGRLLQYYLGLHRRLGIDLNDPRTSWGASSFHRFSIHGITFHDEVDGNPVHLFVAGGCLLALLFGPALRRQPSLLAYAGGVVAVALLFVFYLKWHPWMSRLHLPWFLLVAPVVGAVMARAWSGRFASMLAVPFLVLGVPWMLYGQERPVVGVETLLNTPRDRQYLQNTRLRRSEAAFNHGKAFLEASHASRVGLVIGNSSLEFWWWAIYQRDNPTVRMQHVNVTDPSGRLSDAPPYNAFKPDALLALDQRPSPTEIKVGEVNFTKQWEEGRTAVYLPRPEK